MWFKIKTSISDEDILWVLDTYKIFNRITDIHKNNLIYTPTKNFFNFKFKGEYADALSVLNIVANAMEVNLSRVSLNIIKKPDFSNLSDGIVIESSDTLLGDYVQYSDGGIEINLSQNLLTNPVSLVATIAHEVAHIKLLRDRLLQTEDEYYTDFFTIISGFGIFTANSALPKMNTFSNNGYTGWQITGGEGYLDYRVISFILALYALNKGVEDENWTKFLYKDVYIEYRKSLKYIQKHKLISMTID